MRMYHCTEGEDVARTGRVVTRNEEEEREL